MRKLGQVYSEMIFVQGYIHCDPHPGNLLVRSSTTGTEIVLLDHGLYQVCFSCCRTSNNYALLDVIFAIFDSVHVKIRS